MKKCGSPSEDGRSCVLPPGPHVSHSDGVGLWDNTERPVSPLRTSGARKSRVQQMRSVAARTAPERHFNPLKDGPIVRSSDPESAQHGAKHIEPARGTHQADVLNYFRKNGPVWVTMAEFRSSGAGGLHHDRRRRELEAAGWGFDKRVRAGTDVLEYRLSG